MKKPLFLVVVLLGLGALGLAGYLLMQPTIPSLVLKPSSQTAEKSVSFTDLFSNSDATALGEQGLADEATDTDGSPEEPSSPDDDEALAVEKDEESVEETPDDFFVAEAPSRPPRRPPPPRNPPPSLPDPIPDQEPDLSTFEKPAAPLPTMDIDTVDAAVETFDDGFGNDFSDLDSGEEQDLLPDANDWGTESKSEALAAAGFDTDESGNVTPADAQEDPFGEFFDNEDSYVESDAPASDSFVANAGGSSTAEYRVAALRGPAIRKISHSRSGAITKVRIDLSGVSTLPEYRVFPLRARKGRPPRVWVDFEETQVGSGPPVGGDGELIKGITLTRKKGVSANVARVEIILSGSAPPNLDWREEGGSLVVILGGDSRLGSGREFPRR